MQLNQATDYAFRVVLYLAALPLGEVTSGVVIADRQRIPPRFLQKIMRMLAAGGLVKSYRGVEGGFALTKAAEEITLYDVIVAMEGPLGIHRCLVDRKACNRVCDQECPVHQALAGVQDRLAADLSSVTFAALAAKANNSIRG
ncbi:Rrf2 family transcriptional regulator [Sporomusa sp.]|uniref:RrF2 family transcriptional regulator n=1 Tax=Sporomusa sp. TaxID=2078658 RepID=UPI002CD49F45|nr:Rrf2 family transcriptional regulator [Sporomusa sp.]MDF2875754.1 cymR 2 [Sporomusa sp.]HWR06510.1 Rrf2 family transcriptional regulator [Sporomusa sp.]